MVGEAADRERLKPATKYVRRPRAPWRHGRPVLSGERPPALMATPWVKRLPRARIPADLADMVKTKPADAVVAYVTQRYMGAGGVSKANHSLFFRALLWVEEVRAVYVSFFAAGPDIGLAHLGLQRRPADVRHSQCSPRQGGKPVHVSCYTNIALLFVSCLDPRSLHVEGLSEKRPSVVAGAQFLFVSRFVY